MSDLHFDEATHTYTVAGRVVPNVTRIIGHLTDFSRVDPEKLETARQQGVAVHKMVELDCTDDLDVDALPDWMRGHYAAWVRFKAESGFECMSTEQRVYHPDMGYAGTLDLAARLPNLRPPLKAPALIDVKRSFYAGPVIGLQLAAYEAARNRTADRERTEYRFALRLDGDGKYRLQKFEDRGDFAVFLACLTLYRWREKHASNG